MKKKISLIILALLAVLLLAIQLALPGVVRSYVNQQGPELLGRKVYLHDVSVNLLSGTLSLDSLTIYAQQPDEEPLVRLRHLKANLVMTHLLGGVLDFDYLNIDGLKLNIEQRDTLFNFSDILLRLSADEDDDTPSDQGLPIVLRDIAITNSYLHYQDLLVHSDFRINNIDLRIPGVDLRELNTSVGMNLAFFDGGNLTSRFVYDERRKTYAIDLQLQDFNMQGLLPYIRQHIEAESFGGTLNGEMQLRGNLRHVLDFELTGNAYVRNLTLHDDDDQEILSCDSLSLGIKEMNLMKNRIGLSHLMMYRPMIDITYNVDSIDNFTRLMHTAEARLASEGQSLASPDEEQPDSQPDFLLYVAQLRLKEGMLFYHDFATSVEPFHYQINDISINAPQFSLTGYNNVKGKARLGQTGSLTLEYHGKLSDSRNMRFNLGATAIHLTDFTPYSLQMFGNEILSGTLSGFILADVQNGDLNGNIHFTSHNPKVSKRHKDVNAEMHVPFRAGIYALTDKDGVCDIDLPMSGNIDEPHFSYKRLIFRTLGRLFVKVCTSPFRGKGNTAQADTTGTQRYFDSYNIDDIDVESFGTDSIGEVLMKEEYDDL